MKRRDLISKVESAGAVLVRHGGKHDVYHNPKTGATQPIPRHKEIMRSSPGRFYGTSRRNRVRMTERLFVGCSEILSPTLGT